MKEKFGWIETELGQVCHKIVDGTHHTPEYTETGIPFISVKDIYKEKVNFDNCKHIGYEAHKELIKRCCPEPDDLLITKSGTIGRMAIVPNKPEFSLFVSVALLKNYKSIINTKFLLYSLENYLNSINISQDIKGGLLKNFHLEDIRVTKINLAPLPEQRAIVSKIEQLFSELDNGIANLKLAHEQLKVYRQAVLKKAFEGELTRKWREQQTDLLDSGDLFEQIRKERGEAAKTFGKKLKQVKPLTEDKLMELPRLPMGWNWVRLGEVTYKIGDVDHKMPKDYPNGIPYVATKDFTDDLKIDFSTSKTISKEDYLSLSEKIKPEIGDIIFPRYGTIGKNILINFNKEFLVSYSCAIIKNIPQFMDVKYVYQYLFSPTIKNEIRKHTRETTQANVGIASIELFVFPLCSLSEQRAIVQEIESRLSVCDKIEQDIEVNLEKAEALRQSILKKAFEGKLLNERELAKVRKAEDWEPAEVLLERIRARVKK